MNSAVRVIVHAIDRALSGFIFVMRGPFHLDADFKRYATEQLDTQHEAAQKRSELEAFRQEHRQARKPFTPSTSSAYRARLAKIRTLEEEVAEKARVSRGIDEQLHDISRGSHPWLIRGLDERRRVKRVLLDLHAEEPAATA